MTTIQPEDGTTSTSTENAQVLIKQHGVPIELTFRADKKNVFYAVKTTFRDGYEFIFSGFSWGYGGTGPAGLAQFFELAMISELTPDDITIDKYGKTFMTWTRL